MIIAKSKMIKSLDDYDSCSDVEKVSIVKISQASILHFVYPEHIVSNTEKKIYKSGFLNMFFSHINKTKKRIEIFNLILDKYDLKVSNRMFQKHVKSFKENYNYYVFNRV